MTAAHLSSALVALILTITAGAGATVRSAAADPTRPLDELWVEPKDLETRDLFLGPAGQPPDPSAPYAFVARDQSGNSPGYDVRDPNGTVWSVKLGHEAQSEVVVSRILWAIGYYQPPTYHVLEWTMTGQDAGKKESGRFRPESQDYKVIDDWSFVDSPFGGMQPLSGLLVAQMIVNNWDLKSSNNKMYENASGKRMYVVRDLGASLGFNEQPKWLRWTNFRTAQGSKNDVEGFEKAGFIDRVEGDRVRFTYRGPNRHLVANITPSDVKWTCQLLSRISDQQWRDAFRAGGYTIEEGDRFIKKIKEKIATGLAL